VANFEMSAFWKRVSSWCGEKVSDCCSWLRNGNTGGDPVQPVQEEEVVHDNEEEKNKGNEKEKEKGNEGKKRREHKIVNEKAITSLWYGVKIMGVTRISQFEMLEGAKSMGAGAAILAAFLALAGTASSPDLASFFLFLGGYWALIYGLLFFHYKSFNLYLVLPNVNVLIIVLWVLYILGIAPGDVVGFADGVVGAEGPPSPPVVRIPEAPMEAPFPHPAPPVIPVLEQPLLPEIQRQDELYRRFLVTTIGEFPGLERISETVRVQSLIERHVEAALVHHGFPPESILMNRHLIRGLLFYRRGRALSPRTYRRYLEEISRLGTRDTRAFQRILRAIQNSEILLEFVIF